MNMQENCSSFALLISSLNFLSFSSKRCDISLILKRPSCCSESGSPVTGAPLTLRELIVMAGTVGDFDSGFGAIEEKNPLVIIIIKVESSKCMTLWRERW